MLWPLPRHHELQPAPHHRGASAAHRSNFGHKNRTKQLKTCGRKRVAATGFNAHTRQVKLAPT